MTAEHKDDAPIPPEINKYLAILSKEPGSMVFAPLAEAYRKAGMLDEAIATAQDGMKLHPNYVSGMVALGRAYFEKGLLAEARDTLEKVLVIAPENIIAGNILGEIKSQLPEVGVNEEAEVKIEESPEEVTPALEVVEDEFEIIEDVELEEFGEVEEVESGEAADDVFGEEITEELWTGESIHDAPRVEEKEPRARKEITTGTIADLYIKQGYFDKAIDIYQTLYDADPDNDDIKRKLEELKKQVEVKAEAEEQELVGAYGDTPIEVPEVGWAEPESGESEVPLTPTLYPSGHESPEGRGGKVEENVKILESWLETIQNERRRG